MAENTKQYRWIAVFKNGIDAIIGPMPNVMSAADNLIYAVEGRPKVRTAPDVYVAFGRPKGDRGSYKLWKEDGIFPQVVVEILSPGNRPAEMARKLRFYETFGAEEYYVYDPDINKLEIYLRDKAGEFSRVSNAHGFISPRLGMRFDLSGLVLVIYKPNGEPFLTLDELEEQRQRFKRQAVQATARADQEQARADELEVIAGLERAKAEVERSKTNAQIAIAELEREKAEAFAVKAEAERVKAEAERERAARLAEKLRALGIDPESA